MAKKDKIVADIIDNLRRVFQVVNEYSKTAEKYTGLTGPQLWAIKVIAELSPICISDLAKRMYLHPTTVVGIVDRLENRELVFRKRSGEDRRIVEVGLTREGRELVEKSPEVAQGLLVTGLEVMPLNRLSHIAGALADLVTILGAQDMPPRLILSSEINLSKSKPSQEGTSEKAVHEHPSS